MLPSASRLLIEVHGREHALLVPVEVLAGLEEVRLGDVRRVDQLVVVGDQPLAHVVLDLVADDPALGVEHRESRADLVREGEQVELGAELAVVALGGLLHARLVGAQLVLARPRGAVDALQLLVLLVAAPVGGGDAGERPAVADHAGVRQVRAAAEVLPDRLAGLRVDVVVDGQLARADLDALRRVERGGVAVLHAALQADQLQLVRLAGELGARLVVGDDPADEPLARALDARHLLLERLQVFRSEGVGTSKS